MHKGSSFFTFLPILVTFHFFVSLFAFFFLITILKGCEVMMCAVFWIAVWLCNSMNCSPAGFSIHGSVQARILEWVVIPFPRGSSQPREWTQVSYTEGRFFTIWATMEPWLLMNLTLIPLTYSRSSFSYENFPVLHIQHFFSNRLP